MVEMVDELGALGAPKIQAPNKNTAMLTASTSASACCHCSLCGITSFGFEELGGMLREARIPKVHDRLVKGALLAGELRHIEEPHAEDLRRASNPAVASAG